MLQLILKHSRKCSWPRSARGEAPASVDSKNVFQDLVKQTLEAFLELEMEEQIGYPKYAPEGRGSGNSRNGSTPKTVRGDFGESNWKPPAIATASSSPRSSPSAKPRSATSPIRWSRSIPAA